MSSSFAPVRDGNLKSKPIESEGQDPKWRSWFTLKI